MKSSMNWHSGGVRFGVDYKIRNANLGVGGGKGLLLVVVVSKSMEYYLFTYYWVDELSNNISNSLVIGSHFSLLFRIHPNIPNILPNLT